MEAFYIYSLFRQIDRAVAALKEFGAKEVYVFGSAVEGRFSEHSDIDMAMSGLPPKVFFAAMGEAMSVLGCSLDLIDLDNENAFTRYLKMNGKPQRVIQVITSVVKQ